MVGAEIPPEQTTLWSKREVDLEGLVMSMHFTVACFNISLNSYHHAPKNTVYRTSVLTHYDSALRQLYELLNLPTIVHTDAHAQIATETVALLKGAFQRDEAQDLLQWERDFRNTFQQAADHHFARERVGREGAPCQTYEGMLAQYARIPEFAERRAPPAPLPRAPLRYETTFRYAGTPIPDHRANPQEPTLDRRGIAEMYLAMLEHVQGLSSDDARRRISSNALEGFTRSLTEKLGSYRGSVRFSILQEEGKQPKIMVKLLDLPAS